MTARAREWLDRAKPAPPPVLAARMRTALDENDAAGEAGEGVVPGEVPRELLHAGIRLAGRVAERGEAPRDAQRRDAIDLLAADALVTSAFEAAADEPDRIPELSAEAMRALSALAAPGEGR